MIDQVVELQLGISPRFREKSGCAIVGLKSAASKSRAEEAQAMIEATLLRGMKSYHPACLHG